MGVILVKPLSAVTPALPIGPNAVAVAALFPIMMGNGAATQAPVREEGSGMMRKSYGSVKRTRKGSKLVQTAMAL